MTSVADIDADAKPHAAWLVEFLVGRRDVALDVDGALHGGEDAGEFGENAVAGRAADPAAVLRDERVGDGAMGRQRRQRALLIDAHQPAVALDIGGEDGDELSFERRRFHADWYTPEDRTDRRPVGQIGLAIDRGNGGRRSPATSVRPTAPPRAGRG
jgi:hypothetical protein